MIMGTILHRFLNEMQIHQKCKFLIFGTFNPGLFIESSTLDYYFLQQEPDINNFYFRTSNHLWYILPAIFGLKSLKLNHLLKVLPNIQHGDAVKFQKEFCWQHSILLCDIIQQVNDITLEDVKGYADSNLENGTIIFNNYLGPQGNISKIQACQPECVLTTFGQNTNTPQINSELNKIQTYCRSNNIAFASLPSPGGTAVRFAGGLNILVNQWRPIFYNLPCW